MMQSSQEDAEREASNGNGIAFTDECVLAFHSCVSSGFFCKDRAAALESERIQKHICTKKGEDQSTCGKDSSASLLLPVF